MSEEVRVESSSNNKKPKGRRSVAGRGPPRGASTKNNMPRNRHHHQEHNNARNNKSNSKNGRNRNEQQVVSSDNNDDDDDDDDGDGNVESSSQKQQTNARPQPQPQRQKKKQIYPSYWPLEDCLAAYAASATGNNNKKKDNTTSVTIIRGTLRVLPFSSKTAATTASFVTCDRGLYSHDVCIPTELDRNRALDGDVVFVELYPPEAETDGDGHEEKSREQIDVTELENRLQQATLLRGGDDDEAGDVIHDLSEEDEHLQTWQDDPVQADLWNPKVSIPRRRQQQQQQQQQRTSIKSSAATTSDIGEDNYSAPKVTTSGKERREQQQRSGRVVHIVPPKAVYSEVNPSQQSQTLPTRRIVGTLKVLTDGNTILLTPNNRSLPQFRCPTNSTQKLIQQVEKEKKDTKNDEEPVDLEQLYFQAEYEYGTWQETHKWPPCTRVKRLGSACVLEDEIKALLTEHDVDHGEFSATVLKDVNDAVKSGLYQETKEDGAVQDLGWKPTPDMYKSRRDYRSERIFTIDPTTAKDLDDALHIKLLDDGCVEVGVHIADVSHFVRPGTAVDLEARRRSTTVYLVDRTVPMLPRPLCEVACSLNENVERLAFSCVWKMNVNGTLRTSAKGKDDVWYGRTVIKSCARLDYSTAQNIIENKVAHGESEADMDEMLWPKSRRPTGGHTIEEVAADVRLMHRVAMARRRLRFENGALGLHGIKLTFQLDTDGQTPLLTAPYPIRDSNRLVEEFMLLANYLVAQRLITHAGGRAVLRCHKEPLDEGLENLVAVAKAAIGFDIDVTSSQSLHSSLVQLGRECNDPLVLQCITQLMMTPMVPADYFAAGMVEPEEWRHFALNIPYYTHFTSPIRRYPDILVHRLLQATIDGPSAVEQFGMDERMIDLICGHCNDKRMKSKKAQERCDRVFLSLFVKAHPITTQLGVVLSVGKSSFTVFVPSLGVNALLYLEEHRDRLTFACEEERDGTRRILLQQKPDAKGIKWGTLEINIFTKVQVTVICRDKPPVDVKLRLEGPWRDCRTADRLSWQNERSCSVSSSVTG